MKKHFKIIPYGELKKMGKIPLALSNPKNEYAASNEEYLNLYYYHKDDVPVAIYDGDLNIEGNFNLDELFHELFDGHEKAYAFHNKGYAHTAISVIWITGNLKVSNTIISEDCQNLSGILVVEQTVTTKNIIKGGVELFFLGDLNVEQISYSRLCAEAEKIVFGEESTYIETDINNCWKIGTNINMQNKPFERDGFNLATFSKQTVAGRNPF